MKLTKKIVILLILFGTFGCVERADNAQKKDIPKTETIAPKIETFSLLKKEISSEISLPAELTSFRRVDVFAKTNGYISELKVDIGASVQAGQTLILLEAPEINARTSGAESRLRSQEAVYTASNSAYNRILEASKVEGTISANDLEQALARKNADYAQLEAARAALREANNMKDYLQIRAPFNGTITDRNVNIGAYVGPGVNAPLLTLQELDRLRLSVSVPELYTSYLNIGDELSFRVNSLKGETFKAKISRTSGALDTRLRSERVEMDVVNTRRNLLPGMVGQVTLAFKSKNKSFVVPVSAVLNTSEGAFVIKVIDGKVHWIAVETGLESKDDLEIFSEELQENNLLVLKANGNIRKGSLLSNYLSKN